MDKIMQYLKWDKFRDTLLDKEILYFSLYDLETLFKAHSKSLSRFISRKAQEGKLTRLKKNLYCLSEKIPGDFTLANIVYQPSYVSLESALSHYSIIPESVYAITSITTKPTREFGITGRSFYYQTIKKSAFLGYEPTVIFNETVLLATKEKALADYLYFVSRGTKSPNDRTDWRRVDINKVKSYLRKDFNLAELKIQKLIP